MSPTIHLYTVCWDEADMLGFFFRHYDPWVDRYVVYDDGSTDGSLDILRAHPKVELRRFERTETESFVLSHKAMQDEAWKESRGTADWIVVTAIDEHLHLGHGRDMRAYLAARQAEGITLLPALGFDMNHPAMPDDSGLLVERVTRGRARSAFNKLSLFRPQALRETGFGPGRHAAEPIGDLRLPARNEVMLWHYKHLGFERNAAREALQAQRLGTIDVAQGFGQHYLWSKERLRTFWDEMEREAEDLARPDFSPDSVCSRPLWWETRPGILRGPRRARPTVPAAVLSQPTVSVLIKARDHAPYVRQSVGSILEQSFSDFEVVVTDDGSRDGTLEILRGFDDPRIRLAAQERSLGISTTMNATIARARGRYLAILNSDDVALPGRLERQVSFLDTHWHVAALFGPPRIIDEHGAPTEPFNDFRRPLSFPDFSPQTWLREFFFGSNCLCAPTAMIRREVYETVGAYDPRLTNLQDLDMWVRMAAAGFELHVLPEELSAFRIRAGHANMSAPRPDTRLRTGFETTKILAHFASLPPALFEAAFGANVPADPARDDSIAERFASLAGRDTRIAYRNYAVEHAYASARDIEGFDRLRDASGTLDALGLEAIATRDWVITNLREDLAQRELDDQEQKTAATDMRERLASAERELGNKRSEITEIESEFALVRQKLSDALNSRERLRHSLSWQITAPLRWMGRLVGL